MHGLVHIPLGIWVRHISPVWQGALVLHEDPSPPLLFSMRVPPPGTEVPPSPSPTPGHSSHAMNASSKVTASSSHQRMMAIVYASEWAAQD